MIIVKQIRTYLSIYVLVYTKTRGFIINVYSKKAIDFHRQANFFELNFLTRKTLLHMVKADRQN